MNILSIKNLILSGIHGESEEEKIKPQRFEINIELQVRTPKSEWTMENTFDYRIAKHIAEDALYGPHHDLLETLIEQISKRLIEYPMVNQVRVSIRKLDIWKDGQPEVAITKTKVLLKWDLLDFDIRDVIEELVHSGGVSFPILPQKRREELLAEAEKYRYQKQPEIVGAAKVREELSSFSDFPESSLFHILKSDFNEIMHYSMMRARMNPFPLYPLRLDEMSLQKYDSNSFGISPHLDRLSRVNIVCIFILKGRGEVALCKDRDGKNPEYLDTTPGNVIILRAPGFLGSEGRPFHFVKNITEERIVFGLRQKFMP